MGLVEDAPATIVSDGAQRSEVSSLVQRSGHLAGAYKLRLAEDGDHIEWVSRAGDQEVVTRDEPGATPLSRLWLWMLSNFVSEDLL